MGKHAAKVPVQGTLLHLETQEHYENEPELILPQNPQEGETTASQAPEM